MRILVCYDVTGDSRRARLFGRLKGFLRPVQESVFEGELPDRRYGELLRMLNDVTDPGVDSVRVYHLCRSCAGLTRLLGTSPPVHDPRDPILL